MNIKITCKNLEELRKIINFMNGEYTPETPNPLPAVENIQKPTPEAPSVIPVTVAETQPQQSQEPAVPTQPQQSVIIPTAPAQPTVPTTQPSYTPDDLAKAAVTLVDSGRKEELQALLQNFGVDSLPALPQERYGEFATALRSMGAPI